MAIKNKRGRPALPDAEKSKVRSMRLTDARWDKLKRLLRSDHERIVKCHGFIAPKGYAKPDPPYISRFGFVWWFWMPRLHIQKYEICRGYANPMVIRIIWLCFAVGLDIGREGQIDI